MGVLAPGKGAQVKVDPRVPMIWVNGKEHRFFDDKRSAFVRDIKDQRVMLLEYQ